MQESTPMKRSRKWKMQMTTLPRRSKSSKLKRTWPSENSRKSWTRVVWTWRILSRTSKSSSVQSRKQLSIRWMRTDTRSKNWRRWWRDTRITIPHFRFSQQVWELRSLRLLSSLSQHLSTTALITLNRDHLLLPQRREQESLKSNFSRFTTQSTRCSRT